MFEPAQRGQVITESVIESVTRLLDDFGQDLHYAWRQLRRAPAFASLVVATLAIGIGANATMVGVIDRLLFRAPPAIQDAGSLVRFVGVSKTESGGTRAGGSYDYWMYLEFKQRITGLKNIAGFLPHGRIALCLRRSFGRTQRDGGHFRLL
jgi:hypothetical protein